MTVIASLNLASNLLPRALSSLESSGKANASEKILPGDSITFDRVLATQQGMLSIDKTPGDRFASVLKGLPELQFHAQQEGWSNLGFELTDKGDLLINLPDQTAQLVPLSDDSRAQLRELYAQAKQENPPHSPLGARIHLTITADPASLGGSALSGRGLMWKSAA